jgi:hypothetical protein
LQELWLASLKTKIETDPMNAASSLAVQAVLAHVSLVDATTPAHAPAAAVPVALVDQVTSGRPRRNGLRQLKQLSSLVPSKPSVLAKSLVRGREIKASVLQQQPLVLVVSTVSSIAIRMRRPNAILLKLLSVVSLPTV